MEPTEEQKPPLTRYEKWKAEQRAVRNAIRERMAGAMTGAFGLVAALAWNDAVKAAIDYIYPPNQGNGIGPKFLYAVIVTFAVAILLYLITKFLSEKKDK